MNNCLVSVVSKNILKSVSVLMCSFATVVAPMQVNVAAAEEVYVSDAVAHLNLGLNQSSIIHLNRDVSDIIVANPSVASAVVRSANNLYLFGKNVGQTNVIAIDSEGKTIADVTVSVERDLSVLRQSLKQYIPNAKINVALMNDNVVLSGNVENASDADQAVSLTKAFISGGEASLRQSDLSEDSVGSALSRSDIRQSQVINLIKILGGQQVTLKVTIAEVNRTIKKELGIDLLSNKSGFSFDTLPGVIANGSPLVHAGTTLQAYLNAMEQAGAMKIVAEPTLTAISGEVAKFHVGGEYNVVNNYKSDKNSAPGLSLIQYGIGLEFKPVVLSPGRISLNVVTEVSEPNTNQPALVKNTEVIQLNRRNASSTIELPSGAAMMIAGLSMNQASHGRQAVPGVSRIPVIGTLFRHDKRDKTEKELVIIVTPYLSKPVNEADLSRPSDNLDLATDVDATFLGHVNKIYGRDKRLNLPYNGSIGYINK